MCKSFFLFVICFITEIVFSQNNDSHQSFKHQFELRHDNDFFLFTDQYYTSGLFLIYRTILKKGIYGSNEQLAFQIKQEIYTPSQTASTQSHLFDRSYAGFAGILGSWSSVKNKTIIEFSMLFGIVGKKSGTGGFQRWFHKIVNISAPLWIDELNNSFHFNWYGSYIKEWKLAENQ